jgi:hypothetical protein
MSSDHRDHRQLSPEQFWDRVQRLTPRERGLVYKAVQTIVQNRRSHNGRDEDGQTIIIGPGTGRAFWVLSALIDGSSVGKTGAGPLDD